MGYFQYKARDGRGEEHQGVMEAASEQDAARKLKAGRLYPVKIKPVRSHGLRSIPEENIIRLFQDLSELLTAGLPVDRALALTSASQTHKAFRRVVQELLEDVQGGSDLSDALGKHRGVFGDLASHMIKAGEASGALPIILGRLAQYMEQRRVFKQSLVSALIYPCILLSMSLLSVIVLLVYVIPKFAQIFQDLHQQVPFLTQIMLTAGVLLKDYGWVLAIVLAAAFWGGRRLYGMPAVRDWADGVLIRLPFFKTIILNGELTRFCRTLGTMIQTGVPMLRAISLGDQLIMNVAVKHALEPLRQHIKMGRAMSEFFRNHALFPPRVGTMLRISEEQGSLGDGLVGLGDYFEKEMQKILQRLMALMEPLVIVFTGLIIGAMIFSMFTAILGINEIQF
jgi:general secretion pathway protein F